ncbi:MAG: hypothetical protein GX436_02040 [Synergistaceae bacterium]|nr:hypothetical protein [Synergistaceae bacterium]
MKLVWILCNESIAEEVRAVLDETPVNGYTVWQNVLGVSPREAHWGDAVWPGKNWAFMAVDEEERTGRLIGLLKELKGEDHVRRAGLKVFVQEVQETL